MSDEAIPTTPHDNLSSNNAAGDNTSKGYLLAQQLCNLQQENLLVGKQNQELALQFHDASNYNQALGFDLYQLDQEIGELEERLANMKNQIKDIDQQTKAITKKADEYKNALRNDKEFSSLARHLRNLQKKHQAASKNLAQLREVLDDPKFSTLDGALQSMQEKIHFLYYSNFELHQQIELMQQLLNEGREGAIIDEDLERINDLSNLKLEYYDMKLFESQLKNNKNGERIILNGTNSTSPENSSEDGESLYKSNKPSSHRIADKSQPKNNKKEKGKQNLYEDVLVPDEKEEGKYKIFRRPLKSDGKRKKYRLNDTETKKVRQTRVQNKNGEEYEYQYEYDLSDTDEANNNNKNRRKSRVNPNDEEIEKINTTKDNLDGFKKDIKTGQKTRIHKNQKEEEPEEELEEEKREKKKVKRPKDKKANKKQSNDSKNEKEDSEYDYEYEYEPDPKQISKKKSNNNNQNKPKKTKKPEEPDNSDDMIIEEEEEEIEDEYVDSEGFSHRRNKKTGEIERYRRFEFSDGKEYEDVIIPEDRQLKTNIKMKRNRIDKRNNCYKHAKKKNSNSDKSIISRHERVLYNNDDEYEYEYEYETDQKAQNRSRKRHRVSSGFEIIPTFNNEDENGFRNETTQNSKKQKEKKKTRTFKDPNGQTYKDTIEKNQNTGEDEIVRRMTKSDKTDELIYMTKNEKDNKKKLIRHTRTHNMANGNEVEYEYEYETDKKGGKILLSKSFVENQEDEIIPPMILKSEIRKNRRDQQGFDPNEQKRKVKGKNGTVYEDVLITDPEDGSQRIIRRIKNGDELQYNEINRKGKSKPIRVRRSRVQNDDKEEYEYEYEYDENVDNDDDNVKRKKTRVPKKGELFDEIGDGPVSKFKKQTNQETGETVYVQKVSGKDGENLYEDVITANDQGEVIVTRRLLSKDKDKQFEYTPKTVTDEKGNKKKLRVRRSKVRYEDGREEEFEYEYDDSKKTKTRKFVPKEEEAIESIIGVPKLNQKSKKLLAEGKSDKQTVLANIGYKDEIDPKTGRRRKVRVTRDEFGQRYEYSKEQDPQTKATRITRRKLDKYEPKLTYDTISNLNDPQKKSKTRQSEVKIADSEREYEYEYEENDDEGVRRKLPKKDVDGFFEKTDKRVFSGNDGKRYEDARANGKIYRRCMSTTKPRHTRVRNEADEEYEYEYDEETGKKKIVSDVENEIIPHIKLASKPRKPRIGQTFTLFKGREIRRVIGADGNEYEDEKIDNKVKRSKIDQNGEIEYKKLKVNRKGKKQRIKERHVLVLNSDDDEVEYEYQYEYDDESHENTNKTRRVAEEKEIESILRKTDFKEKVDPRTNKKRYVRKVTAPNGDVYEDEIDRKKKRIVRRKLANDGTKKYSYFNNKKNNKRTRRSRVGRLSPLHNDADEEYEYEYEYEEGSGEAERRKVKNEVLEPIEKLNPKRYIMDSSEFCEEEEEDPETGELKTVQVSKHKTAETVINPTTGKPLTVRQNGKDYQVVFDRKSGKTLRQRKVNDSLLFEYDDDEIDKNGKPLKTAKKFLPNEETEGGAPRTRHVVGKNGAFYLDTFENAGRIRRRVVNSASSSDLVYKRKQKSSGEKLVRRSRVHELCGEEREYEYEYENEDDEEPKRKVVSDKKKQEIEVIKKSEFEETKKGSKAKIRKIKGKEGDVYEDSLENGRITRRILDKKGQKLRFDVDEEGRKIRRSRVRNENDDEYEYEYEYDENNDSLAKKRVHPNDEKIERIDGAKKYKGGFFDLYETVNGSVTDSKRKVRKVKGSNNQTFEDELIDGKIKRRPLNRKGKISYKRKNDKTVRQQRVRNAQGDEYEYEYEYDDDENRKKYRIDPNDERIQPISISDDEYEYEYDESEDEEGGDEEGAEKEEEGNKLEGFESQKNEKTGEIEKSRKLTNSNGHIYKDTIEKNENTGDDEIHRRMVKNESTNELEYSRKLGKNHENKIVRRSRTHNLTTGDETEYEYEYETDESGEKAKTGKKKKIENPNEEMIQAIFVVHTPKRNPTQNKKEKSKSKSTKDQSDFSLISENGFHLPVSLFQSEDQSKPKPKLQPSNPAIMQKQRPPIVDLSEYENKVNPDKKNPLATLIPKLRAENGNLENDELNSPENLQKILEALQQQIAERTEFRDSLKDRIKELENPHYVKKNTSSAKKAQKFKMSGIKRVNIDTPPDPIKALALNNYDLRHIGSQTELTGDTITYHQNVLDKQRREKLAAEELRASLESLKEKIRNIESKIEKAKEDGQMKEERIKALKVEIANVKDELLKEDKNALREEAKAREYAQQLSEIDEQIRIKQQQLEKINSQVGALHIHLKEMQKFRVILESELANLVNREKPEIRQLIEDVNSYRIQIDVSSANVESMTKKVEAKRQQLEELLSSDEMNQYTELKLKKVNLERRIKKWTSLMKDSKETLQSIETFSAKNANIRRTAIEQYKNKVRSFMKQEIELDDLEKYQELVESMIREHKQNWT